MDDEADRCYLVSAILREKNIRVLVAYNLIEFNKILQQKKTCYFILLDNILPDGFGLTMPAKLEKAFPGSSIIVVTARDTPKDRRYVVEKWVDIFLTKPFTKDIIIKVVEKLSV